MYLKMTWPAVPRSRLPVLDELKGMAMVMVLLYHTGGVLGWKNVFFLDSGVDIFVILSGVVLGMSERLESSGSFMLRRIFRVMPAYWAALAFFLVLDWVVLDRHYTMIDLGAHLVGMQGWCGDTIAFSINNSFWFITLILSLYIIYGLTRRWLAELDQLILVGAIASILAGMALLYTDQLVMYTHLAMRLPRFFFGLMIGRLLRDGQIQIKFGWVLAVASLILSYIATVQGIFLFVGVMACTAMIIYIYLWRARAPRQLVAPVAAALQYLGAISLELFLLHQPLIKNYNYYFQKRFLGVNQISYWSLIAGVALGLAISIVLAKWLHELLALLAKRKGFMPSTKGAPPL